MDKREVIHTIEDIISNEVLHRKIELSVGGNTSIGDLGIDSLKMLTLFTRIETVFSIIIEDEYWNLDKLSTVEDLVQFILDKLSKGEENDRL